MSNYYSCTSLKLYIMNPCSIYPNIKLSCLIILLLISSATYKIHAQNSYEFGKFDSTYVYNGKQFKGTWAIYKSSNWNRSINHKIPNFQNNLIIQFGKENTFTLEAGNAFWGRYYVSDSNKIKICYNTHTDAAYAFITKDGFKFIPDRLADSLRKCNSFMENGNTLEFYNNNRSVMTLKPYRDFFLPQTRPGMTLKELKTIKVDTAIFRTKYLLINDSSDLSNYHVGLDTTIDFSNHSLLIVKNSLLKRNKKVLSQFPWRSRLRIQKNVYPNLYTNYYYSSNNNKYYVDISEVYFSDRRLFSIKRNHYTGYIIQKVIEENLVVTLEGKI